MLALSSAPLPRRMAKAPTPKRPDDLEEIAKRLRLLRTALGLTQTAFVKIVGAGLTDQNWNNFERARGRITVGMAIVLCQRFGISLDWIYRGEVAQMPVKMLADITRLSAEETGERKRA